MGSLSEAPAAALAAMRLEPQHDNDDLVAEEVASRSFLFRDAIATLSEHKSRRWLTGVELTDEDSLVQELVGIIDDAGKRLDREMRDSLVFYTIEQFAKRDASEGMSAEHERALAAKTA